MLLVEAPPTREAERRYILEVVLGEWLGLDYRLESTPGDDVRIRLSEMPAGGVLRVPDVFFATEDDDWLTERSIPATPVPRIATGLPVPYGRASLDGSPWQRDEDGILLAPDVFGTAFFFLSRYEEVVSTVRDSHGRFPASASVAWASGFLERPIVDEQVDLLWAAMQALWPAIERRPTSFRLRLTHDVDEPWSGVGHRSGEILHALAGDLLRRRDPDLAWRRTRGIVDARRGRFDRDPYDTFDLLMATSERHGLRSTFYFLAGNVPGEPDFRYRIDHPRIVDLLARVHDHGHEVGLHASYDSYLRPDRIEHEFAALRAACRLAGFDQPAWGVRQHYLRFEAPRTWRAHESAGFEHDSTLGFADAPGFRAGTSREYPLFDVLGARPLRLRERPLLVMDVTMLGYLAMSPTASADLARVVIDAARRHHGDAVVLYHNSTLPGRRLQAHYRDLVDSLDRAPGGMSGAFAKDVVVGSQREVGSEASTNGRLTIDSRRPARIRSGGSHHGRGSRRLEDGWRARGSIGWAPRPSSIARHR